MKLEKVSTEKNLADLMTKHLNKDYRRKHMDRMGLRCEKGRSSVALSIHRVVRSNVTRVLKQPSPNKVGLAVGG